MASEGAWAIRLKGSARAARRANAEDRLHIRRPYYRRRWSLARGRTLSQQRILGPGWQRSSPTGYDSGSACLKTHRRDFARFNRSSRPKAGARLWPLMAVRQTSCWFARKLENRGRSSAERRRPPGCGDEHHGKRMMESRFEACAKLREDAGVGFCGTADEPTAKSNC